MYLAQVLTETYAEPELGVQDVYGGVHLQEIKRKEIRLCRGSLQTTKQIQHLWGKNRVGRIEREMCME